MTLERLLFPDVAIAHWQMMPSEQIALTGILARLRPKGALEVGVYHGGSITLTSQFAKRVIGIDIDPEVQERFVCPRNVELRIGSSQLLIPAALADFMAEGVPLNFVLIDADHSTEGVKRDLDLILDYTPTEALIVLMHDSGNPATRAGLLSVDWARNKHVHAVEIDFVPGQIQEHAISQDRGEVWGGLAIAYLDASERVGDLVIRQSSQTTVRCLNHAAADLSFLK